MMAGEFNPAPIAGLLLAGGQSRRMGCAKDLLVLGGHPLAAHVLGRLRPQVRAMAISASGDPRRFAGFGLPVLPDPVEGFQGPLAGVLAGMRWAASLEPPARWLLTAACDTPFIPSTLAETLLAAAGGRDSVIALASSGGRAHPVCGLWPVPLADDLDAALRSGTRKMLAWAQTQGTVLADFAFVRAGGELIDPFFNINTPEDLREAERLASLL